MRDTFANRLRQAMENNGITAAELSRRTGLSKPLLSQYLHGTKNSARQDMLCILADALGVSEPWLMGFDVPMVKDATPVQIISRRRIPLLGEIACGEPIMANQEFESYVAVGADVQCDFCLRAKGDSMIGARIHDGDIVFIREQPLVNNGEIAAVIIDNEATLKRVFLSEGKLVLQAENPKYAPLVYVGDELNYIRILGKAIAFQSDVR